MFLLAYRTSKHETTGVTPPELYFTRNLRLPLDLLRGSPPNLDKLKNKNLAENYVSSLKKKLEEIHSKARENLQIKSTCAKSYYDRKARQISFREGQKI